MPVVRKSHDSCRPRNSFEFLSDPVAIDEAMRNLRKDYYAASSRRPRDAMIQTWTRFHKQWFGNEDIVPPWSRWKRRHASSSWELTNPSRTSLSRVKEVHTESGYPWTQQLHNAARRCTRSVLRGVGGPTRSEVFDLDRVVSHHLANDVASSDDLPLSPLAAVVVGVLFLLRELELSAIDMKDVSFTDTTITLSLPVSKVDWQAKGCRRTWSCKCDMRYYCPVHILRQYDDELRREGKHTAPWIISRTEGRCSKNAVVTKIRQAVLSSGGTAKDAEDNWIIFGHTFRITGARTLSAWGLDPITIQLLGRWGSNAVLSYLAETPLLSFSDRLTNRSAESHLSARHVAATDLDGRQSAEIVAEQDQLRRELRELKAEMSDLSTPVGWRFTSPRF